MRAPTKLVFCAGTPDAVQEEAKRLYREEVKPGTRYANRIATRIERVAGNDRMTEVWQQLKGRSTDDLVDVFKTAATRWAPRTLSKKTASRAAKRYARMRADLQKTIDEFREQGSAPWLDDVKTLQHTIATVDLWEAVTYSERFVVQRLKRIQDPEARDLAIFLSWRVRGCAGEDEIIAEIVSVALNREIDERTVKYWLHGH